MTAKLRVGVVGLGRIFDLNARGYLGHPEAEIVALCDSDEELLARRFADHPGSLRDARFRKFLRGRISTSSKS